MKRGTCWMGVTSTESPKKKKGGEHQIGISRINPFLWTKPMTNISEICFHIYQALAIIFFFDYKENYFWDVILNCMKKYCTLTGKTVGSK